MHCIYIYIIIIIIINKVSYYIYIYIYTDVVNNLSHVLGVKLSHWERCIDYIGSSATKTVRMIWALSCYTVLSSKGFQQDNVNCINKHWDWLNQQDGSVSVSKIDIVGKPWVGQEPGRSHQGSAGAMAEPGSFMAVVSATGGYRTNYLGGR